jgi:hypothetical protein
MIKLGLFMPDRGHELAAPLPEGKMEVLDENLGRTKANASLRSPSCPEVRKMELLDDSFLSLLLVRLGRGGGAALVGELGRVLADQLGPDEWRTKSSASWMRMRRPTRRARRGWPRRRPRARRRRRDSHRQAGKSEALRMLCLGRHWKTSARAACLFASAILDASDAEAETAVCPFQFSAAAIDVKLAPSFCSIAAHLSSATRAARARSRAR